MYFPEYGTFKQTYEPFISGNVPLYDVVILDGGLGNNLFQLHYAWTLKTTREFTDVVLRSPYAKLSTEQRFVEIVAKELGLEVRYENSGLDSVATRIAQGKRTLSEREIFMHQRNTLTVTRLPAYRLHCGYWQSAPSFVPAGRNLFDETLASLLEDGNNGGAIVHIRGGDYLSKKNFGLYALLDMDYYRGAFQELESRHRQVSYEVVTNDLRYAEQMLSADSRAFKLRKGKSALDDFCELSRHQLIVATNSTFCWWAARIGLYKGQTELVIAPSRWLNKGYNHRSYPRYVGPSNRLVLIP